MLTTSIAKRINTTAETTKRIPLLSKYIAYAAAQEKHSFYWYLYSIMLFPCVVMIPTIFVYGLLTDHYVWFIGLSVLLFYANVIAHIGETKSTFYVPLFHLTTFIMVIIPLVTLLMSI